MDTLKKNKNFIIEYFNAISGAEKPLELIEKYVADEKLKGHIQFFESAFPKYELMIDELTAEANRVVVRARWRGRHEGALNGIPPTHKQIEMPFVIGYEIENGKIIDNWMIADQMLLMEQLGLVNQPA